MTPILGALAGLTDLLELDTDEEYSLPQQVIVHEAVATSMACDALLHLVAVAEHRDMDDPLLGLAGWLEALESLDLAPLTEEGRDRIEGVTAVLEKVVGSLSATNMGD